MLHFGTLLAGRPPAKTLKAPHVKFCTSSRLYAVKESSTLTKVYAFTSLVNGVHRDLHEVTHIRTKVAGDKVDNIVDDVEMCPDAADCPWTSELPYVISNWSDTHVRMDCFDDFAFWCSFPEGMLPTPFVSSPSEPALPLNNDLCTQPDTTVEDWPEADARG